MITTTDSENQAAWIGYIYNNNGNNISKWFLYLKPATCLHYKLIYFTTVSWRLFACSWLKTTVSLIYNTVKLLIPDSFGWI